MSSKFKDFIEDALRNADDLLGDRTKYVGASDISQCLKKVYLSKISKVEYSLEQLIVFERGHVAEGIIKKALISRGLNFKEQERIKGGEELPFTEVGPDFIVFFKNEIVVIECKTISSPLPNNVPRESWVEQVQLQMHLVEKKYKLPTRSIIASINLNSGEINTFDLEPNKAQLELAQERAKTLWNCMQTSTEPEGEVSELCAYCPFKGSCSSLRKGGETLPQDVIALAKRLKELSAAEKEAKEIRENLKAYMEAASIKKGVADEITISLSNYKGKESVDLKRLKEEFPEIAKEVTKVGDGYSVLKVY